MSSITKKKNIFSRRPRTGARFRMGLLFGVVAVVLGVFLGVGFLFFQHMPDSKPAHEALLAEQELEQSGEKAGEHAREKAGETKRGVVVFTGGQGRVEAGFDVLEKFSGIKYLLISGVNPQTTQQEVLKNSGLRDDGTGFSGELSLDYQGQTTFGNIAQTSAWVDDNNLTHIILVTSSYHVPRAKLLLQQKLPETGVTVYPVFPENVSWRVLAEEYLKYAAVHLNNLMGGIFFREKLK